MHLFMATLLSRRQDFRERVWSRGIEPLILKNQVGAI